jgi:hypothetical protein
VGRVGLCRFCGSASWFGVWGLLGFQFRGVQEGFSVGGGILGAFSCLGCLLGGWLLWGLVGFHGFMRLRLLKGGFLSEWRGFMM